MSNKKTEKELKFRLSKLPDKLDNPCIIEQTYLFYGSRRIQSEMQVHFPSDPINWEKIAEARIRKKYIIRTECTEYSITLKSDGSLERTEYENSITEQQYNEFKTLIHLGHINKTRYTNNVEGLIVEVDKYEGVLNGLLIAEIEYDQENKDYIIQCAIEYLGSDIFDVTEIKKYKNKSLAGLSHLNELFNF